MADHRELFVGWLQQWKEDEMSKKTNVKFTYQKAIKAIRECPHSLSSGREAQKLNGIGPFIAMRLDDELAKLYNKRRDNHNLEQTQTTTFAPHSSSSTSVPSLGQKRKNPSSSTSTPISRSKSFPPPPPAPPVPRATFSVDVDYAGFDIHDEEEEDVDLAQFTQTQQRSPPKKRKAAERKYVPTYRSGGYAILLTLLHHAPDGHLKKEELIRLAQPLSDKPFHAVNGNFYSAWSSFKTLAEHGLVLCKLGGNQPAKYSLTDKGYELALELEDAGAQRGPPVAPPPPTRIVFSPGMLPTPESERKLPSTQRPSLTPSISRQFDHYDSRDLERKDDTWPAISEMEREEDHDDVILMQVLERSKRDYSRRHSFEDESRVECDVSPSLNKQAHLHSRPAKDVRHQIANNAENRSRSSTLPPSSQNSILSPSASSLINHLATQHGDISLAIRNGEPLSSSSQPRAQLRLDPNGDIPLNEKLLPTMYDIFLIVDSREMTNSRDTGLIQKRLGEIQVPHLNRDLSLGDFMWIARERVAPVFGQIELPQAREYALDYVIERKRLDDLCSSMQDGRYSEQKFRLKTCGVKKPIYLIEDYVDSMKKLEIFPEETINQAIVNTMVVDGFFIKKTRDINGTIEYLTIMTRYIQEFMKGVTIADSNYEHHSLSVNDKAQKFAFLRPYREYLELTKKTKPLTARELFVKQLIQLHGLPAAKAINFVKIYPTPACLMKFLQKEKPKLISLSEEKQTEALAALIKTATQLPMALCHKLILLFEPPNHFQ